MGTRFLDTAIALMLGLIALRIAGADDPRAMVAGYLVTAGVALTVPIALAALALGVRGR